MEQNAKINQKKEISPKEPTITIFPYTIFLLSCKHNEVENITTIGWVAPVCNEPPMFGISLRNSRYSLELIQAAYESGKGTFALNVPSDDILKGIDCCGIFSGKKKNKVEVSELTMAYSSEEAPPIVVECPVNLEFKVTSITNLGSHSHIIGSLEKILVDEFIDPTKFVIAVEKQYFSLRGPIGDCLKVWKKPKRENTECQESK